MSELDLNAPTAPFLAIEFSKNNLTLRFFTTLTSFSTPHDVTLQELRIESFFAADEETELALQSLSEKRLQLLRPTGRGRAAGA
ncbi:MAG: hypothetical protein JO071_16580 [Deltaproteobacteria bacterium]|nr:hypothetical protein [Deltaproteobacteria bacterium]